MRISGFKPDPLGGMYNVTAAGTDDTEYFIRGTRVTPSGRYTDDFMLVFLPNANLDECTVTGLSRSQSLSFYDFGTNYCNLEVPLNFATYTNEAFDSCWFTKDLCVN
jgi:hypothetical protein